MNILKAIPLLLLVACGCNPGERTWYPPKSSEIVVGEDVFHFEPYLLGGGGNYVRSIIVGVKAGADGEVVVSVINKNHSLDSLIVVNGKRMIDGHKVPGYTVPEWHNVSNLGSSNEYYMGEECVERPAEKIPTTDEIRIPNQQIGNTEDIQPE